MSDEIKEAVLEELHVTKEHGIEATFSGEPITVIADYLAKMFVAQGGENYVVLEFDHAELGPFSLTIQRRWGKQIHAIAAELRSESEWLKVLRECEDSP